jgi:predicted metal-dependent HD superfamily phosphohydrolase
MEQPNAQLLRSWISMWQGLDPNANHHMHEFALLIRRYKEPHRTYHNLEHIAHCLRQCERVRRSLQNVNAVMFAIWYHDAIYDPKRNSNEEESSQLANRVMTEAELTEPVKQAVTGMIRASKHNRSGLISPDCRFFLDIDLSILGSDPETYAVYEAQIQKEYSWVSEEDYRKGRADFLRKLLPTQSVGLKDQTNVVDQKNIFHTIFFREKYEDQAKENLAHTLELLG